MGLLRDIQTEIEKRSLSGGGWSSGNRGPAAIETTSYALMALAEDQEPVRRKAIDALLRTQNPDGSWPAFEGDDQEGCWTTSLALIALRSSGFSARRIERAGKWLLDNKGREGQWFWKWKFRTVDRAVQFNPDKYGWPWFPETVSWVIPTAFALIALKQSLHCCGTKDAINRIQIGTEMLRDRACPQGGWNAGNGIVFGSALIPHVDTTAIALLALAQEGTQPPPREGLNWLRAACAECSSAYSLAWASVALQVHRDPATALCIERLKGSLWSWWPTLNVETLSLAAIAINVVESNADPFRVLI